MTNSSIKNSKDRLDHPLDVVRLPHARNAQRSGKKGFSAANTRKTGLNDFSEPLLAAGVQAFLFGVCEMNAMMNVIQTQIGGESVNAVNARDLHAFLQVGKDFSTWVKNRIDQYGFSENFDFACLEFAPQNGGAGNRGVRIEYMLSLNMAKELAMVERNDRGKQARQYFIECERQAKYLLEREMKAKAFAALPDFTDPIIAARAWADEKERGDLNELALREVQAKVIAAEPKLKALDVIAGCDGSMCITNAAKTLQIGPKSLFRWLSENQWIYRRAGGSCWIAYQERIQSGVLEHKVTTVERSDGSQKVVEQVLVTSKGLTKLAELTANMRSFGSPSSN